MKMALSQIDRTPSVIHFSSHLCCQFYIGNSHRKPKVETRSNFIFILNEMKKAQSSKKKLHNKDHGTKASAVATKCNNLREAGQRPVERKGEEAQRVGGHREKKSNPGKSRPIWDIVDDKYLSKRSLHQPESRSGNLDDELQETNVGQDFEMLAEAPLSTGRFEFKSEKNWTLDVSDYDEFFSIDLNNLAAIINCIPFNKLIEVDDEYFTKDELTHMYNTAEQAKRIYNESLEALKEEKLKSQTRSACSDKDTSGSDTNSSVQSPRLKDDSKSDIEELEEDLDLLLSLKEPVRPQPVAVNIALPSKNTLDELKTKNIHAAAKSIDLEKWLDLVLED